MKSIVIGSGFGGIAAALRLKAKNHDVTLIEKHPDLGGRARVFKRNGFTFDGGPTVITAPHLIEELFALFNKSSKDYIKLTPLKTWYRFIFEDGMKFDYSASYESMETGLAGDIGAGIGGLINDSGFKAKLKAAAKGSTAVIQELTKEASFGVLGLIPGMENARGLYDKFRGQAKNPNLESVFKSVPFREFNFPFTFAAKNEKEKDEPNKKI